MRPVSSMLGQAARRHLWLVWLAAVAMSVAVPLAAHAGYYDGPVYSGGTLTMPPPVPPMSYKLDTNGYGNGGGGGGTTSCSGTITATFTWVPTAVGDLPPDNVIVKETSSATWKGYGLVPPTGTCSNGLGFAAVDQGPIPGVPSPPLTSRWYRSSGTRYRVVTGEQTLQITCAPGASASSNIFAGASVWYTAEVYPVLVRMDGANVHGWMFHPNMIVGAGATSSISTGPMIQTAWSWSVSGGDPFSDYYTVPANTSTPDSSVRVPLTPTDQATAHFYFGKWEGGNDVTVVCDTHVAVPTGAQPSGGLDVSGELPVRIDKPSSSLSVYMGDVQLMNDPDTGLLSMMLWGAVDPSDGFTWGTIWKGAVQTPSDYADEFNPGGWNFTQLWTPSRSWGPPSGHLPFNGLEGLDNRFGYDPVWTALFADDGSGKRAEDAPGSGIVAPLTYSTMNDRFVTYMLYRPPGQDTRLVALKNWEWYAAGSANWSGSVWQLTYPGSGWEFVADFPYQAVWARRNYNM